MHGQEVPQTKSYKYLGVTITNDLSWGVHTQKTQAKASRTLAIIRRTLGKCDKKVKVAAYNQLVRPQLEYATCTWNPHTQKDSQILENIHRQAARFVSHDYSRESSVTSMLSSLDWDTLQHCRILHKSEMLYKIHYGFVNIAMPEEIRIAQNNTRNHNLSYLQPFPRVNCHLYSFYPRAIRIWNTLPAKVGTSGTLMTFRSAAFPVIRHMAPPPTLKML
ncbi:uncharacterized protein [Diadema setosum]|uniref:uncharacterized protein n=1 Tax=Diadema setosum TaxID=31175 RepID=UPI003B3B1410